MDSNKDLKQLSLELRGISYNIALSNYLLCKTIVAEPQIASQSIVLQNLSLQNSLMLALQNTLQKIDPTATETADFEK